MCWPAARASARPFGVTHRGPLGRGAGPEVLGQTAAATLLEAGGRVGEAPRAVSWGGSLGPRVAVDIDSQGSPACISIRPCPVSGAARADLHVNLRGRVTLGPVFGSQRFTGFLGHKKKLFVQFFSLTYKNIQFLSFV